MYKTYVQLFDTSIIRFRKLIFKSIKIIKINYLGLRRVNPTPSAYGFAYPLTPTYLTFHPAQHSPTLPLLKPSICSLLPPTMAHPALSPSLHLVKLPFFLQPSSHLLNVEIENNASQHLTISSKSNSSVLNTHTSQQFLKNMLSHLANLCFLVGRHHVDTGDGVADRQQLWLRCSIREASVAKVSLPGVSHLIYCNCQ